MGRELSGVVHDVMYLGLKHGYPNNPGGDYRINRNTLATSALVKLLYITNGGDNRVFDTRFGDYAEAVARGVCEAFGITYLELDKLCSKEDEGAASAPEAEWTVKAGPFHLKREATEAAEPVDAVFEAVKDGDEWWAVFGPFCAQEDARALANALDAAEFEMVEVC